MKGKKAKQIRNEKDFGTIPSRKFYDIRRKITKTMQKSEIDDFNNNCERYINYFHIIHHWKKVNVTNVMKYNGTFILARRFDLLPIALDVVFMDDTACVNIYGFPLVTICFEDYNKVRQILSFSFIPGREQHHFKSFLVDVKNHTHNSIRVFIIDHWKAQLNAILDVFPEAQHVFCRIHF